jgi:hypothetical protein
MELGIILVIAIGLFALLVPAAIVVIVVVVIRRSSAGAASAPAIDGGANARLAADPTTPATVLGELAGSHPELRAAIAANPAAYPDLLNWLGQLGDPQVDAALRARASA